jgi:hypothetical protein
MTESLCHMTNQEAITAFENLIVGIQSGSIKDVAYAFETTLCKEHNITRIYLKYKVIR